MFEIFMDALVDTAGMLPFLVVVYAGISFIEGRYGAVIADSIKSSRKTGPALGAVFGIVPQCGFSVISTALYTKRVISVGTLLAVYLSTSDEAIPVILAQPEKAGVLAPLLASKALIAIVSGYTIDFVINRVGHPAANSEVCAASEESFKHNKPVDTVREQGDKEKGCCGHTCSGSYKPTVKEILIHPLIHTAKIFFFIFAASLFINFIIFQIGEENLHKAFLGNSVFQPFIVALIGLIPNCASSVAITEVFLKGGISFGSTVAGLSAGSGLGLLVLFKESANIKETLKITGLLFFISVAFGTVIQLLYG